MAFSGNLDGGEPPGWGISMSQSGSLRKSHDSWRGPENIFSRSSQSRRSDAVEDDEEALKWAALERLPTVTRLRTAVYHKQTGSLDEIDVAKISPMERQHLIDKLLKVTEDDNEKFLLKLRKRIDK